MEKKHLWKLATVVVSVLTVGYLALHLHLNTDQHAAPEQHLSERSDVINGTADQLKNIKIEYTGVQYDDPNPECTGLGLFKGSFPDVEYALMGYDILKGYPLTVGKDAGLTQAIFHADYTEGFQTADCLWSLPRGFTAQPDVSCVTSFKSEVVKTSRALSKSMESSVTASGGGWGGSFSASVGYRQASSEVSSGESVIIISKAKCIYYSTKLLPYDAPRFHRSFVDQIIRLNNSDDDNDYLALFETYGTHFITESKFGASYTFKHKMSQTDYELETSQGYDVSVTASYSGAFSVGMEASLSSEQKQKVSEFRSKVKTETVTVGSPPPADGDALTWASEVKEQPLPIHLELTSIENLFTEHLIGPKSSMKDYAIDYEKIKEKIKTIKTQYCFRLLQKGLVDDCTDFLSALSLRNTKLEGKYREVRNIKSSFDCISLCYDLRNCEAVDFCEKCSPSASDYQLCRVFSGSDVSGGSRDATWEATLVMPDLEQVVVLPGFRIEGAKRALSTTQPVTNAYDCFDQCASDDNCAAFSFCLCPEKKQQCTLYTDNIYQLVKDDPSVESFIVSRKSKGKDQPLFRQIRDQYWEGPICKVHNDCRPANSKCINGSCSCPELSTFFSPGTGGCVSRTQTNLALGKNATQSSTSEDRHASRAVDGNSSTDINMNSCSHTAGGETNPWWKVDLGDFYEIKTVVITNRGACANNCEDRLRDIYIQISPTSPFSELASECNRYKGVFPAYETKSFECYTRTPGRYVRILKATEILTLCEVEVIGSTAVAYGSLTTQSSTEPQHTPSEAVDGIMTCASDGNDFSQTKAGELSPWWQLHLRSSYEIHGVTITNKQYCPDCKNTLKDFHVEIFSVDPETNPEAKSSLCHYMPTEIPSGATRTLYCQQAIQGQYIRIRQYGEKLALCEVQVLVKGD